MPPAAVVGSSAGLFHSHVTETAAGVGAPVVHLLVAVFRDVEGCECFVAVRGGTVESIFTCAVVHLLRVEHRVRRLAQLLRGAVLSLTRHGAALGRSFQACRCHSPRIDGLQRVGVLVNGLAGVQTVVVDGVVFAANGWKEIVYRFVV